MNDLNKNLILPDAFNLTGSVALVTGGSGLLGFQHADALAEIGANVVIADLDQDQSVKISKKINSKYSRSCCIAIPADVTSREKITNCLQQVLNKFGKVDILVNNAAIDAKVNVGGLVETSRFEHFSLDQWHDEINVGLTGAFLCSQIVGNWMKQNEGGVILNIASDLSVIAPDQRLYAKAGLADDLQPVKPVTYPVIKTALIGLTRYLATYWKDNNIRVNALSPGGVFNDQNDDFVAKISSLIPLGRMAYVNEYRSSIQFLCSDASSYMTGHNLVVDGGRSIW